MSEERKFLYKKVPQIKEYRQIKSTENRQIYGC